MPLEHPKESHDPKQEKVSNANHTGAGELSPSHSGEGQSGSLAPGGDLEHPTYVLPVRMWPPPTKAGAAGGPSKGLCSAGIHGGTQKACRLPVAYLHWGETGTGTRTACPVSYPKERRRGKVTRADKTQFSAFPHRHILIRSEGLRTWRCRKWRVHKTKGRDTHVLHGLSGAPLCVKDTHFPALVRPGLRAVRGLPMGRRVTRAPPNDQWLDVCTLVPAHDIQNPLGCFQSLHGPNLKEWGLTTELPTETARARGGAVHTRDSCCAAISHALTGGPLRECPSPAWKPGSAPLIYLYSKTSLISAEKQSDWPCKKASENAQGEQVPGVPSRLQFGGGSSF